MALMPQEDSHRMCIVTREVYPPCALIRFVLGPEGWVVPDLGTKKLPGRGAWVALSAARVAEAEKRKLFSRTFKSDVKVPATLVTDVDMILERDALQALA